MTEKIFKPISNFEIAEARNTFVAILNLKIGNAEFILKTPVEIILFTLN